MVNVLTQLHQFILQVADGAIQRLGDRSHCLTELHLDHCRELTSSAVETLSKVCVAVNTLSKVCVAVNT